MIWMDDVVGEGGRWGLSITYVTLKKFNTCYNPFFFFFFSSQFRMG